MISYIVLMVCWCSIIVLYVHAQSKEKSDNSKDSFYEELDQVFHNFLKYLMQIMLGDINEKWGVIFSNRQLGMRVHIRIVMIMELE